jgi:hypothetical protein
MRIVFGRLSVLCYVALLLVINKIVLPGLDPRLGSMGFLVDKVALELVW